MDERNWRNAALIGHADMVIELDRYFWGKQAVISRVTIDGEEFGVALEDVNERIKAGTYRLGIRKSPSQGGRDTVYLRDVPGQTEGHILVHVGNDDKDTRGCILLGRTADEGEQRIFRSIRAVDWFNGLGVNPEKSPMYALAHGRWVVIVIGPGDAPAS